MKRLPILTFFLIFFCQTGRPDVLIVPSIQNPTIQSAINNSLNGDTIIVQPGTYRENINFFGKAITLKSTDPNEPNIVAATIIDGNQPADFNKGSVVTFNSGEKNNSELAGFTITGGSGSWLLVSWRYLGLRWNRCGGGAVCFNMSEPTIKNNIFINNYAAEGGGIYIYGNPVNPGSPSDPPVHVKPVITNNQFINNSAIENHGFLPPDNNYPANDHGDGGAIVGFQGCDPIITANTVENNYAYSYGGGIHLRQWCSGRIQNNRVINNNSLIGAGIHITYSSSPLISGNFVENNYSGSGGALYIYYLSQPVVERNIIKNNSSPNDIIGIHYGSAGIIRNNLIADNNDGPAIVTTGSNPLIINNTIINNQVAGIQTNIYPAPQIRNNIIASTRDGYGIDGTADANPVILYNNIWNNEFGNFGPDISDPCGTGGNISIDPQLLDGLHLNYISPCVNAGDPNFTPAADQNDIDGDSRLIGAAVDIGADEVVLNPMDLNIDGFVNCLELQILVSQWLLEGESLQTDFYKDERIDFLDLAILAEQWLWSAF